MIIGIPEILLGIGLIVLPIACLTNWAAAFKQLQNGEPLVETEYQRNVPWGLLDLGIIVAIVGVVAGYGVKAVAQSLGIENPSLTEMIDPKNQGTMFLIFGSLTLVATALCFVWIHLRYHRIVGFSGYHFGPDVELGMRWFVMLVVPVLLIQLGLTQLFESKHPLTEMLTLTKNSSLLPIAAFSAMIAAPIFEETFFRLFLQGWLEKLQVTASRMKCGLGTPADSNAVLFGGDSSASLTGEATSDSEPHEDGNPYRSPTGNGSATSHRAMGKSAEADDTVDSDEEPLEERPIMWVPILVSSGLFALAHVQHGPDWVPLFFLAIGLGYLYQRTQRILPSIVVHMLINTLGIVQIWSHIRQ